MKVYKFSEKQPRTNKPFLFVHNALLYCGVKEEGGFEFDGDEDVYYGPSYHLFKGSRKYVQIEGERLIQQGLIGDALFEYWFYLPDLTGLDIEIKEPIKSIFHSFGEDVELTETSKTSFWNIVEI
jgi:hypothetical protein